MRKTAHYRNAIWLSTQSGTSSVEFFLREALESMPTVERTKFEYRPDVNVQVSNRSCNENSVGCYFTLYTEGEPAGTIENGGPSIGRATAPTGQEFLKTGIHLVIQGNNMGYIADGHTNDGQISALIHKLFKHAGLDNISTQFNFMARANRQEIERLLRVGVKSIDMGFSNFVTSAKEINQSQNSSTGAAALISSIITPIANALGTDTSLEEIRAASDINARMHLSFDGRSAGVLVPNLMGEIAGNIYDDSNDDFKIITKQDVVVTRDKLVIKKDVNVEGDSIAINSESAYASIRLALSEWNENGLLDG